MRMCCLEVDKFPEKPIVFSVRDVRIVENIVPIVVAVYLRTKLFCAVADLRGRHANQENRRRAVSEPGAMACAFMERSIDLICA